MLLSEILFLPLEHKIHIFTCEVIISLHVRISYRFYQFVITRYTTDFYIKKWYFCVHVVILVATYISFVLYG